MFFPQAIFCRVFQTAFRMTLPVLPYREPEIINSCSELDAVFCKEQVGSVLVVTDKGIVNNGLHKPIEAVLQTCGVSYVLYDDTQPNPTVQNVEDALKVYQDNHFYPIPKLMTRRELEEFYYQVADWSETK